MRDKATISAMKSAIMTSGKISLFRLTMTTKKTRKQHFQPRIKILKKSLHRFLPDVHEACRNHLRQVFHSLLDGGNPELTPFVRDLRLGRF